MNYNLDMTESFKRGPNGIFERKSFFNKLNDKIESMVKKASDDGSNPFGKKDEKKEDPKEKSQGFPKEKSEEKPKEKSEAPKEDSQSPKPPVTFENKTEPEVPADQTPQEAPTVPAAPPNGNMLSAVIDYLQQNPNPQDSDMHAFAEQNGFDTHQLETVVYTLATKMVNILRGGKMNEKQFDINTVDPNELEMGMQIELEHTSDSSIAKKISCDHLSEIPDYYSRLKVMEDSAKSEQGAAAVPIDKNKEKPFLDKDEIDKNKQEEEKEMPVGSTNRTEN